MVRVIVDGENLSWMREPLGIGSFDLPALYKLLANISGEADDLYDTPAYVVSDRTASTMGKALRASGFDVIVRNSPHDDAYIKEGISKLNERVDTLVLVSCDSDFIPSLQDALAKGVKVVIVGTRQEGSRGPMLGEAIETLLSSNPEGAQFVDLYDHRLAITRSPWQDRRTDSEGSSEPRRERDDQIRSKNSLAVTLSGTNADLEVIAIELFRLIRRDFPGVKISIEM